MTTQTEAQRLAAYLDAMALDPALCHHTAFTIVEKAAAELLRLEAANAELVEALLVAARSAEALKHECSMSDPESAQATRNTQYMSISYAARAAIAKHGGQS